MFRLILPITLILAAGVGSFFLIGPVFNDPSELDPSTERVVSGGIFSLQQEIKAVNEALENARRLREEMSTLEARYRSISPASLASVDKMVPSDPKIILLYPELIKIAETSGLFLENISVGLVKETSVRDQTTEGLQSIDISFSAVGNYSQLLSFLSDISSNIRIMDIDSLVISPFVSRDEPRDDVYNYSFNIKAYWLK